jgi:hypothetical protein
MMHSAPRAAFAVPARTSALKIAPAFLPKGARPAPRAPRAPFMTRRYETAWLSPEGFVESATRIAPALPEFEEAFSAVARGTLIETPTGLAAVEDLAPGMEVLTAEGRTERILWIGSMTLFPPQTVPGLAPATMTRITAEAFGPGRPMPDLLLGAQARLHLKDARCRAAGHPAAYVPAKSLIDGESIVEITPMAPVSMYNLVLERHGSLRCAGIEVEAYHPGRDYAERFDPQLAALFLALFPTIRCFADFGPLAHARLTPAEAEEMVAA